MVLWQLVVAPVCPNENCWPSTVQMLMLNSSGSASLSMGM
jgi:hypothetical protein